MLKGTGGKGGHRKMVMGVDAQKERYKLLRLKAKKLLIALGVSADVASSFAFYDLRVDSKLFQYEVWSVKHYCCLKINGKVKYFICKKIGRKFSQTGNSSANK